MKSLQAALNEFKTTFSSVLKSATDELALEQVRITFLSRKGHLSALMEQLKTLSLEEKRTYGPLLNELKQWADELFLTHKDQLVKSAQEISLSKQKHFDVTATLPHALRGSLHPLTHLKQQIENIFISMGYQIVDGPEVETDYYNFEALNIPADHPARDMWDTFWLDIPSLLLRTHTSPVQVHEMEKKQLPLAVIAPGRCYRHEATDATHDFQFMQLEGLVIDTNISMSNLLATCQAFLQAIFKKDLKMRIRPSYFPFTEPGIEIDITCPFCTNGCSVCKYSRWIETCGAGLVHPRVLQAAGIDTEKFGGFAFGFGLTRLAMLTYGINDIRLLHSGKIEFLEQFS